MNYRVWCENKKEWEKDEVAMLQNGNLVQTRNMQPLRKETHIVEFSTGLKDIGCNCFIHEGDIIDGVLSNYIVRFGICPDTGITCFYLENVLEDFTTYELKNKNYRVIGNIHENPELLEAI